MDQERTPNGDPEHDPRQDPSESRGLSASRASDREPRRDRDLGSNASFELHVIEGPSAGLTTTLDPRTPRAIVGTSAACAIQLADPRVTSRQCGFQLVPPRSRAEGARLQLLDLSPDRTTRVNGVLASEAFLAGGEVVRVGDSLLLVKRIQPRGRLDAASPAPRFGRLRGESDAMRALYPTLVALVGSPLPVLLEGERGVGKRLLADELHRLARDAREPDTAAPFVVVPQIRDASMPASDGLFADGGALDRARGGTLYIEEIRTLDDATQQRLVRVLDEMAEGSLPASTRVRILAATRPAASRPNAAEGAPSLTSTFHPDLAARFFGSRGRRVVLPPLRVREGDVPILARQFWSELGGASSLPDDFLAPFDGHGWPGNVRELRVAVESCMAHGTERRFERQAMAARSLRADDPLMRVIECDLPFGVARSEIIAEFEKRYVERALARSGRSVSRAAAASGLSERYFRTLKAGRLPA